MGKNKFLGVGLIAVLVISIVLISGCVEEETPTKKVTTTEKEAMTTVKETISKPTTTLKETTTTTIKQPSELTLNVGETAKTNKIEVTVKSVEKVKHYQYYSDIVQQYYTQTAPQGKTFILADVEIKNIGNDRVFVGSSEFSVTDFEEYRYDPEMYLGEDGLDMFKELYQNQKMRGKVLFKVPDDAQKLKMQYDFGNLFTGVKLATWNIN